MPSFERTFQIPPSHHLEQVRTRACAGVVTASYWDHEEYDAHGRLVARYHTFREFSKAGEGCRGWRKYDKDGHIVGAHNFPVAENSAVFDQA